MRLRSLTLSHLQLTTLQPLHQFLASPFLQRADFSYNPLTQVALTELFEWLPITVLEFLDLSYLRMTRETLDELSRAVNNRGPDSSLFLKHLNLDQVTTSDRVKIGVQCVHFSDCIVFNQIKQSFCFECALARKVLIRHKEATKFNLYCQKLNYFQEV